MTNDDLADLRYAKSLLENPSLAARISNAVGSPIEKGLSVLPEGANDIIITTTRKALETALDFAISTMNEQPQQRSADWLHKTFAGISGAAGGAFGLSALAVELGLASFKELVDQRLAVGDAVGTFGFTGKFFLFDDAPTLPITCCRGRQSTQVNKRGGGAGIGRFGQKAWLRAIGGTQALPPLAKAGIADALLVTERAGGQVTGLSCGNEGLLLRGYTVGSAHDVLLSKVGGQHNAWEWQWLVRAGMDADATKIIPIIMQLLME